MKSSKNTKIVVVGAFHEIIELIEGLRLDIAGLIDNNIKGSYLGYKILGTDQDAKSIIGFLQECKLVITPDKPQIRKKIFQYYNDLGCDFFKIISRAAIISKSARIEMGGIIQGSVNISSNSKVGRFVKLNTNSNIMHDVTIGDFTTIAPNSVVLGNVFIGSNCYIGANATILPNISICADTIIGAAAVVTKSISVPGVYVGNPARMLNKNIK